MKLLSYSALKSEKGIGYSRVHLARLVAKGEFPAPIKLGAGRVGFVESELDAWIESKMAERDAVREAA